MALCLANSLITQRDYNPYDQLVRYKWWYRHGYMSSTGQCFDIGAATSDSLNEFERRQRSFATKHNIVTEEIDCLSDKNLRMQFNVYCSNDGVAGNGALMRLTPVPLFFHTDPAAAVEYSGRSGQITHGDIKAYDACRYYGALIVGALQSYTKAQLLDKQFYSKHEQWFGGKSLCKEIKLIAEGSYQKNGGYDDGIRGKGYIVNALEAALWAFWSDDNSFEKGALAAVNLGDDTDTTAAIYGQLAGAHYGYKKLPPKWVKHVYARDFMLNLSEWIVFEGERWQPSETLDPVNPSSSSQPHLHEPITGVFTGESTSNIHPSYNAASVAEYNSSEYGGATETEKNRYRKPLVATHSLGTTGQQNSLRMLTTNKEASNYSDLNQQYTYETRSRQPINDTFSEKPNKDILTSSPAAHVAPYGSSYYSRQVPKEHYLHGEKSTSEYKSTEHVRTTGAEERHYPQPLGSTRSMAATGQRNSPSTLTTNQAPWNDSDGDQSLPSQMQTITHAIEMSSGKPISNKTPSSAAESAQTSCKNRIKPTQDYHPYRAAQSRNDSSRSTNEPNALMSKPTTRSQVDKGNSNPKPSLRIFSAGKKTNQQKKPADSSGYSTQNSAPTYSNYPMQQNERTLRQVDSSRPNGRPPSPGQHKNHTDKQTSKGTSKSTSKNLPTDNNLN